MSEKAQFKLSQFKVHPLNVSLRMADDRHKRHIVALGASIKSDGWRQDAPIVYIVRDSVPLILSGRCRFEGALGVGLVDLVPPQIEVHATSDAEVAEMINSYNPIDTGMGGYQPHSLAARLSLALCALPQVDFVTQGKFSASQTLKAAGIRATNGGERELSSSLLTLAKYFNTPTISECVAKNTNAVRQYLSKKRDITKGEQGGIIPQLEAALKSGDLETIEVIRTAWMHVNNAGWEGTVEIESAESRKEKRDKADAEKVTATIANMAVAAKSTIERECLRGTSLTQHQRIVLDYWYVADAATLQVEHDRIVALSVPAITIAAKTKKTK